MDKHLTSHDTFIIEKNFNVSPERVFAAWSDSSAKSEWFPKAEKFDFRVGGREVNQSGPNNGPIYTFEAQYQEIIPNERIIYSYIMDLDDKRISVSLTTVEFKRVNTGTQLIYTEQGVFLDGYDNSNQREHGTRILLDRLEEVISNNQKETQSTKGV